MTSVYGQVREYRVIKTRLKKNPEAVLLYTATPLGAITLPFALAYGIDREIKEAKYGRVIDACEAYSKISKDIEELIKSQKEQK